MDKIFSPHSLNLGPQISLPHIFSLFLFSSSLILFLSLFFRVVFRYLSVLLHKALLSTQDLDPRSDTLEFPFKCSRVERQHGQQIPSEKYRTLLLGCDTCRKNDVQNPTLENGSLWHELLLVFCSRYVDMGGDARKEFNTDEFEISRREKGRGKCGRRWGIERHWITLSLSSIADLIFAEPSRSSETAALLLQRREIERFLLLRQRRRSAHVERDCTAEIDGRRGRERGEGGQFAGIHNETKGERKRINDENRSSDVWCITSSQDTPLVVTRILETLAGDPELVLQVGSTQIDYSHKERKGENREEKEKEERRKRELFQQRNRVSCGKLYSRQLLRSAVVSVRAAACLEWLEEIRTKPPPSPPRWESLSSQPPKDATAAASDPDPGLWPQCCSATTLWLGQTEKQRKEVSEGEATADQRAIRSLSVYLAPLLLQWVRNPFTRLRMAAHRVLQRLISNPNIGHEGSGGGDAFSAVPTQLLLVPSYINVCLSSYPRPTSMKRLSQALGAVLRAMQRSASDFVGAIKSDDGDKGIGKIKGREKSHDFRFFAWEARDAAARAAADAAASSALPMSARASIACLLLLKQWLEMHVLRYGRGADWKESEGRKGDGHISATEAEEIAVLLFHALKNVRYRAIWHKKSLLPLPHP